MTTAPSEGGAKGGRKAADRRVIPIARCNCSGQTCSCAIRPAPGGGVTVSGLGSGSAPYLIGLEDLGNPALTELSDIKPGETLVSGDLPIWNGTGWEFKHSTRGTTHVRDYGVVGDGVANDAAALNAAATAAAAAGTRLIASGSFRINSTVTINCDADLSGATFTYYGTGIAVQVGSATALRRKTIQLPSIINGNKTVVGWAQVLGSTGLKILNTNACRITCPYIRHFAVGLLVRGEATGCVYNEIGVLHLDTNQVQHDISSDTTGWSNENKYRIGWFSYASAEGANVTGTRNIRIQVATNIANNNIWFGGSLENDTPQYHVECAGFDNRFIQMRWENVGGCRVYWRNGASRNEIDGGYDAHQIVETFEAGALPQYVHSAARSRFGAFTPGSAVANTNYVTQIDSTGLRVKQQTGAFDRTILASDGKVYIGSGTAAPLMYLAAVGTSGIGLSGGHLYAGTDNAFDIGLAASQRFRYIRASAGIQPGSFTTAGRPTAATAGAGAMIYDTTLSKPVWSNGTVWKDAAGTTV